MIVNAAEKIHQALGYGAARIKSAKPPRGQRAAKAVTTRPLWDPRARGTYVNPVRQRPMPGVSRGTYLHVCRNHLLLEVPRA